MSKHTRFWQARQRVVRMIRTKRVSAITTAVLAIAPALTSTVLPSKRPLGSAAFVMRSDVTMTELTARTVEGRGAVSDRAAPFRFPGAEGQGNLALLL
jgi:hypothetical protein